MSSRITNDIHARDGVVQVALSSSGLAAIKLGLRMVVADDQGAVDEDQKELAGRIGKAIDVRAPLIIIVEPEA